MSRWWSRMQAGIVSLSFSPLGCGSDVTSTTAAGSGSGGTTSAAPTGATTAPTQTCPASDLPEPFCHTLERIEHSQSRPIVLLPIPAQQDAAVLVFADGQAQLVSAQNFSEVRGASDQLSPSPYLRLFKGDFDGDGTVDIGQSNDASQQRIQLYSGVDLREMGSSDVSMTPRAAGAFDVDGDERDEVISALGTTLQVWVASENTLVLQSEHPDAVLPCAPEELLSGEFNGDALADLAVPTSGLHCPNAAGVDEDDYRVKLLAGGDSGTLDAPPTSLQPNAAVSVAAGDVDGDGIDDLVLQDATKVTILGGGETGFTVLSSKSWQQLGDGGAREPPLVGDVDGDGQAEIVLRGFYGNSAMATEAYLYWSGDIESTPYVFPTGDAPSHLADLNGDGKAEILTVLTGIGTSSTGVYWSG